MKIVVAFLLFWLTSLASATPVLHVCFINNGPAPVHITIDATDNLNNGPRKGSLFEVESQEKIYLHMNVKSKKVAHVHFHIDNGDTGELRLRSGSHYNSISILFQNGTGLLQHLNGWSTTFSQVEWALF